MLYVSSKFTFLEINPTELFLTKSMSKYEVESVWDYPRPPKVEPSNEEIVVVHNGVELIRTNRSFRVLETSHPPTYYLPISEFNKDSLVPVDGNTFCEFKGRADYFDLVVGDAKIERFAWEYPEPTKGFVDLIGHIAFYPASVDKVTVDGEQVIPQEGGFYGGWITSRVKGPFKGAPGTWGW